MSHMPSSKQETKMYPSESSAASMRVCKWAEGASSAGYYLLKSADFCRPSQQTQQIQLSPTYVMAAENTLGKPSGNLQRISGTLCSEDNNMDGLNTGL